MKKLVLLLSLLIFGQQAMASLLVSPLRITFAERERTKIVHLINTSNTTRSYKLEWVHQKQMPDGSYQKLTEQEMAEFPNAADYIRFSPRRVTLKAPKPQNPKTPKPQNPLNSKTVVGGY